MIEEAFVSFEIAKLLKEKGFNEPCIATYNLTTKKFHVEELYLDWSTQWESYISAPTHQMAMSWLRKMHHLHIGINPVSGKGYNATIYDVADFDDYEIIFDTEFFFHPEEAIDAALKHCLEKLI